jgi:thiamine biosynthesis lipoprotein
MSAKLIRVSRPAMGSLFEIYAGGEDLAWTERAAREALDRVEWLEQQLSHYLPDSEICRINARAYQEPVFIPPYLMALLLRLRELSERTEGAFDCTKGQLAREWGLFRRGQAQGIASPPNSETLQTIAQQAGWSFVALNTQEQTIRFLSPYVELHLGAAGKGYVTQRAADCLREMGLTCALLHSGQSSIVALGAPPESEGWTVGLADPGNAEQTVATLTLRDAALSTSGGGEQGVYIDGRRYSHLFDPRTGQLLSGASSVSVWTPDATEGDALSTAFSVLGEDWTRNYCRTYPETGAIFCSIEEMRGRSAKLVVMGNAVVERV